MRVRDGATISSISLVSWVDFSWKVADGSASLCQDPVSTHGIHSGASLTCSDFISTAFPEGLDDDDELDVIVMDFALDDFCM